MPVLLLVLLGLPAAPARAQDPTPPSGDEPVIAQECCLTLLLPVSAASVSLGQTLTPRLGADAVFGNPAGLAGLHGDQLVVHHSTSFAGEATAFSVLFARDAVGTLGISYQLLDGGEIESTDDLGNPTGTLSIQDHLLVASFATYVAGDLAVGLNYKLYHFRGGCAGFCGGEEGIGTTHAIDAGVRYRPSWLHSLQVGATLVSLGFPLQIVNYEQADALPTRLRIGAAYNLFDAFRADSTMALWLSAELSQSVRDRSARIPSIGLELAVEDAVFLRAGYVRGQGLEGWTALGVGLRYERFLVSIAKPFTTGPLDPEREPFHVSFGMSF